MKGVFFRGDNVINKPIFIEIDKPIEIPIHSVQFDKNSRFINVYLLNNSLPLDVTRYTVTVAGVKPDGQEFFNECDKINSEEGLVRFEITEQMNVSTGIVNCEIKVYNDSEGVLTTKPFSIKVTRSLLKSDIESTGEFRALTEAISKVQGFDNKLVDLRNDTNEKFAQTNAQLSDLISNHLTVSVKDFGAKGDGVSDDTNSFLSALKALEEKGGILYIPRCESFYNITNEIELNHLYSNVVIRGEGAKSHLKLTKKSLRGHLLGFFGTVDNPVQNIIVENLGLSTYIVEDDVDDNALGVSYADNITFRDITVFECQWKGITAQYHVKNLLIDNCKVENCKKNGIAIEFDTCDNIKIKNSIANYNKESGIHVTSASSDNKLNNLKIQNVSCKFNTLNGISLANTINATIQGAICENNGQYGLHLWKCVNTRVNECNVNNSNYAGLNIQDCANTTIKNTTSEYNSLEDSLQRGNIFITEGSSNTLIESCIINQGIRAISSQTSDFKVINTDLNAENQNVILNNVVRSLDKSYTLALDLSTSSWVAKDTNLYGNPMIKYVNNIVQVTGCLTGGNISPGQTLALIPTQLKPTITCKCPVQLHNISTGDIQVGFVRLDRDGRIVIEKAFSDYDIYLDLYYVL